MLSLEVCKNICTYLVFFPPEIIAISSWQHYSYRHLLKVCGYKLSFMGGQMSQNAIIIAAAFNVYIERLTYKQHIRYSK